MTDLNPDADAPLDPPRSPAHRARVIAAAVGAGAFVGIGVGLVATHYGDDSANRQPAAVDAPASPFAGGGPSGDQFGGQGGTDLDGDGRVGDPGDLGGTDQFDGTDQFGSPSDQFSTPDFGGAAPAPFGGQSAPDTNSGGS